METIEANNTPLSKKQLKKRLLKFKVLFLAGKMISISGKHFNLLLEVDPQLKKDAESLGFRFQLQIF